MQHLQKEMTHPLSLSTMNPLICLSIDSSIIDSSVSTAYKMEVMLFIALRERLSLKLLPPHHSGGITELVYIEEVDFESRQLTLFHMNDSSLSYHRYVENDYLLSQQPQLLLSMM
ncbi:MULTISPECIES: hypothetical protein [unclassified Exiguobacterium]|uniref:hypothetical protein n=1 Tax=unclassified Exiguobacterium TaxID=2644629 RepID=UPI00040D63E2|nr:MULTISPECIES: hypothetical protein [unclassified Exiguobacterium]MCQ4090497.1 hypothetical protein [Exiguobacterium sp. LL15]